MEKASEEVRPVACSGLQYFGRNTAYWSTSWQSEGATGARVKLREDLFAAEDPPVGEGAYPGRTPRIAVFRPEYCVLVKLFSLASRRENLFASAGGSFAGGRPAKDPPVQKPVRKVMPDCSISAEILRTG